MFRKILLLIFSALLVTSHAYCKDTTQLFNFSGYEVTYHNGLVLPHTEAIDYVTSDYIHAFSLGLLYQTPGNKAWQKIYGLPIAGFAVNYSTLGNKKIFGQAFSLYPFFEAPVITTQRFRSNYRISFGLAYVTKKWDLYQNFLNLAISTNLNIYFNLMLNVDLRINNKFSLFGGAGLTHISNGKIKDPNKGINTFNGSMGVRYKINDLPRRLTGDYEPAPVKNKNILSLIWSHGIKNNSRFDEGYYYVSSLNLSYERKYAQWGKYGIGTDAFFDESIKIKIQETENAYGKEALFRMGAHISHDFIVNDVSLTMQLGYYYYEKIVYLSSIYNRVGIKYRFTDHLIANLSLKSHQITADFIEFGIGYCWF